MSKIYSLSNSTKEDIGRRFPQCKGVPSNKNFSFYDRPNSMTNLTSLCFPNFEPELVFELNNDAIKTNVISPSNIMATGFLIDRKMKRILDKFKLCKHKYYNAEVLNYSSEKYFWLHLVNSGYDSIDFKLSTFYSGYYHNHKLSSLEINSLEDFQINLNKSKNQEIPVFIFYSNLCLKKEFSELDLYFFPELSLSRVIISSKLKTALELEEITGIEICEIQ